MTNKEMFDTANKVGTADVKALVRERFLKWCQENGRTPANPITIQDWWKEEWK